MIDYYKTLGVDEKASKQQIKRAHRQLYTKNHPDRFKNSKQKQKAQQTCKKINEAYNTLIDDAKRQQYDLQRSGQHQFNAGDNFKDFGFGEQFTFEFDHNFNSFKKQRSASYQLDIHKQIHVTVEQAYYGCKINIKYDRYESCQTCKNFKVQICRGCGGTGTINILVSLIPCMRCKGTGYQPNFCSSCKSRRYVQNTRVVPIIIPAKTNCKQILKFSKQGNTSDKDTGALYVQVLFIPDKQVQCDKEGNLYITHKCKLETVLKRQAIIVNLFKQNFTVNLPSSLSSNTKLEIQHKGLRYKGQDRNLYITLLIDYPRA